MNYARGEADVKRIEPIRGIFNNSWAEKREFTVSLRSLLARTCLTVFGCFRF
jgi:hypothetical protein